MRILVDMDLSPAWCEIIQQYGCDAVHWSAIGAPEATDAAIMEWARKNEYAIFTHTTLISAQFWRRLRQADQASSKCARRT